MPKVMSRDLMEAREVIRSWLAFYEREWGMSRTELAQTLGLSKTTVSNVLNSKEWPGLDMLIRMHTRLGLELPRGVRRGPDAESAKKVAGRPSSRRND